MRTTPLASARAVLSLLLALALVATGAALRGGSHAKAQARLAEESRITVVVEPAVLSIPPSGPATLYHDERDAVTITADRAGGTAAVAIAVQHSGAWRPSPTPAAAPVVLKQRPVRAKQDTGSDSANASPVAVASPVAATGEAGRTQNIPTVLVHGTWQNKDTAFAPELVSSLQSSGFDTYSFNYGVDPWTAPGVAGAVLGVAKPLLDQLGPLNPVNLLSGIPKFGTMLKAAYDGGPVIGGVGPIEDSTQQLSRFIDQVQQQTGAPKVNLVGDSQGGLVIKSYLSQDGKANVANVVDINSTNHGTTLSGPGKLLDLGIVDDLAQPVHQAITNLGDGFNGTALQVPAQIAAGAANLGVQIAQSIVKVPVGVVQSIARTLVALAVGPAAAEQAVGSDFINKLNATPDTKPGINYLVLASTDDKTSTPYKATYLQAGPGASVANVEEHTLPGAEHLDIEHVDQPAPVVKAIVDYLNGAAKSPELAKEIAATPGVTVTVDNGVATVESGTKVLYQGPSGNADQIKQSLQQAVTAVSPTAPSTDGAAAKTATAASAANSAAPASTSTSPATGPAADKAAPAKAQTSTANAAAANSAVSAKTPNTTGPATSTATGAAGSATTHDAADAANAGPGGDLGGVRGGLGLSGQATGNAKAGESGSPGSAAGNNATSPTSSSTSSGAAAAPPGTGPASGPSGSLGLDKPKPSGATTSTSSTGDSGPKSPSNANAATGSGSGATASANGTGGSGAKSSTSSASSAAAGGGSPPGGSPTSNSGAGSADRSTGGGIGNTSSAGACSGASGTSGGLAGGNAGSGGSAAAGASSGGSTSGSSSGGSGGASSSGGGSSSGGSSSGGSSSGGSSSGGSSSGGSSSGGRSSSGGSSSGGGAR